VTEEAQDPADAGAARKRRLTSWFQRWRRPLRQWFQVRSTLPDADIDDLAQEVFLRLLRYSDDILIDNPQGYLFRIAANVTNEWCERARHKRPNDESWLEDLQVAPVEEPENDAARNLVHDNVRGAVARLAPRQREVLLLHVADGLTYMQIAERLGLTERIVLRDLSRAYGQLRMQLDLDNLDDCRT
jgi:RNA polymerase sigma factor (sigma-70 family)